jgi:alanyl-tRNA synthetase
MFGTERSFTNHIERRKSKCDYHFDRNLTDEERQQLQDEVNRVIGRNLPVTEKTVSLKEAEKEVNTDKLPGNVNNLVRIVYVGDYDKCPCSGLHVNNTSEIGEFKINSTSLKEGVLRIIFKLINN